MPHTTAMIARRARFIRLKEEQSDTKDTTRWKIHLGVDPPLYSTPFAGHTTRIKNILGIDASEKNDTKYPISVPEYRAAKKNRLQIHWKLFLVATLTLQNTC
jgi:hypothetical protein